MIALLDGTAGDFNRGRDCTTFGLRANNGLILCTNILALGTTLVSDAITFETSVVMRGSGASGTCFPSGTISYPSTSGSANALAVRRLQNGPSIAATVTIDTTVDQVIDFFITPGATTHGFTLMSATLEIVP